MEQESRGKFTFDYIIVGTGPAGAVLAKRLTDDKRSSALVLEAGDNNSRERPVRDSLFAPPFILTEGFLPQYFWQGEGIPQPNANKRTFHWTGGRTLGGGSSINNQQYVRPSQANMRQWERLLGPEWSPEKETRQFKRLENFNGQTNNPNARGFQGRLDIRQAPVKPTQMAEKLVKAMEQATGFPRILDYNDPQTPIGPFTRWQLYQMPDTQRESADTAFLSSDIMTEQGEGVNGRRLRVLFKSTALQILFNNRKEAIGVRYLKEGQCFTAYGRKKIIISAGINSPQLLMLSGIGPEDQLRKAGIPIVYQNPNVGRSLKTHTANTATLTTNPQDRPLPADDPYALYTAGAFLPDPTPGSDPHRRGVQLIGQTAGNNRLNLVFFLLEPKSSGSVRIQNDDPLKIVLADEGFFAHPADMKSLKNIYRIYIQNIANALSWIDPQYQLLTPGPEILNNDRRLENFIMDNVSPTHHIQGTLPMAPSEKTGVVDASGHVFGVSNLIVADDSIAPFASDGNTSAPAFFIGANIADQLLSRVEAD